MIELLCSGVYTRKMAEKLKTTLQTLKLGMFPLLLTVLNRDYSASYQSLSRTVSMRGNIQPEALTAFRLRPCADGTSEEFTGGEENSHGSGSSSRFSLGVRV